MMQKIAYMDVTDYPIRIVEAIRKLSESFGFEYNAQWIEDELIVSISTVPMKR